MNKKRPMSKIRLKLFRKKFFAYIDIHFLLTAIDDVRTYFSSADPELARVLHNIRILKERFKESTPNQDPSK